MAARAGGWGHLRASHADRERVVGVLKAAFVEGRLAKDEFDLRVGQTFAARTYAELAALTADLPAAKPPQPTQRVLLRPGRVITAASALYGGGWAALLLSPHVGGYPLSPLMLDGTFVYLGILIICVAAILVSRGDRRSGQQPPGRGHGTKAAQRHLPRPPSRVHGRYAPCALPAGTAPASGSG